MQPSSPLDLAFKAHQAGRHAEARNAYERILAANPNDAFCRYLHGLLLLETGLSAEARAQLEACCRLRPDLGLARNSLGNACLAQGDLSSAKQAYSAAIACTPPCLEAYCNLGSLLRAEGALSQALDLYDCALRLKPDFVEALCNRSVALKGLGRFREAEADLLEALRLQPSLPEARFNLGLLQLLHGDFARGWENHELRWETEQRHARRQFPFPALKRGQSLHGKSVLVYAEQGLGDTLQFCRFLPRLEALGARVHVEVPAGLFCLLKGLPGLTHLLRKGDPLPGCDFHCALLSLPYLLELQEAELGMAAPYLHAAPDKVLSWKERLLSSPAPRVGLVWFGNRQHKNDRNRSIPGAILAEVLKERMVPLISLQKGPRSSTEEALFKDGYLVDLEPALQDFSDTAAALSVLDLLVTVDTSVAHLAGALGIPVRLLLPFAPDWRWQLDRTDSPWYPSVRLYRQPEPGAWAPVLRAALS